MSTIRRAGRGVGEEEAGRRINAKRWKRKMVFCKAADEENSQASRKSIKRKKEGLAIMEREQKL